jgi:hypothetical protein
MYSVLVKHVLVFSYLQSRGFLEKFQVFKKFKSFFEYLFINCLHIGSRRQGQKSFRNFKKFLKNF